MLIIKEVQIERSGLLLHIIIKSIYARTISIHDFRFLDLARMLLSIGTCRKFHYSIRRNSNKSIQKMKIIFLDHDGVICLSNNWGSRSNKKKNYIRQNPEETVQSMEDLPVIYRFDSFDSKAVILLNKILEETGAEIVVSSDWKRHATLEEMKEYYIDQGICKTPIAFTPNLYEFEPDTAALFSWKNWAERARCLEIQRWLLDNPVESWVAVDDLNMSNEYLRPGLDNFVLTARSTEGIKQLNVSDKIKTYLNENISK